MFFDGWFGLLRILVNGVLAYLVLILWLRISGKRTLSKWNAFDFVVTIALGSTLATVIMSKDIVLLEGVLGLGLLIGLQFLITWLSVRSRLFQKAIKANPTLLLCRGKFVHSAIKKQRVTESEIRAAIRSAGIASLEEVEFVVLETDGSMSVIKKSEQTTESAMTDVLNHPK